MAKVRGSCPPWGSEPQLPAHRGALLVAGPWASMERSYTWRGRRGTYVMLSTIKIFLKTPPQIK